MSDKPKRRRAVASFGQKVVTEATFVATDAEVFDLVRLVNMGTFPHWLTIDIQDLPAADVPAIAEGAKP